ncbi:MAG: DUF58 domain-containing protein [Planctomycetota bacterium]|nr:DUF58 domain-containing protein [Planctomycetota bacterium]MDA1178469.1 DUF58 domain-containing protein [Planctomycetota bacterium]
MLRKRPPKSLNVGQLRRRRVRICREGLIYLAVCSVVLLGSILRDVNLLLVLACMMIGPFLLNGIVAASMLGSLRVSRDLPPDISAQNPWRGAFRIDNRIGKSPVWTLLVHDALRSQAGQKIGGIQAFLPYVGSAAIECVDFSGPALPRGRYHCGPLTLTSRFPFGLLAVSAMMMQSNEFYVTPELGSLGANWVTWLRRALAIGRDGGSRRGRSEGEFHAMRDWRPGDPRKWIHWRTTARRNVLTVRELESPRNKDLFVIVDLSTTQCREPKMASHRDTERMLSFVATLVVRQCTSGAASILLGLAGKEVEVFQGAASSRFQDAVLRRLAVAEVPPRSTLPQLLRRLKDKIPREAIVLLVTGNETAPDPTGEFSWMDRCTHVPVLSTEFRHVFALPSESGSEDILGRPIPAGQLED